MSYTQRVLVTGATGTQGSGVVRQCLEAGHEVYAMVRRTSSSSARRLARCGARIVRGDLDDARSLALAVRNVDAVFLNVPYSPTGHPEVELQRARNVIIAAQGSGTVSTFVYTSALMTNSQEGFAEWGPDHPQYHYWMAKYTIESFVQEAGFPYWAILRPGFFLQNFLPPLGHFMFPSLGTDHLLKVAYDPESRLALLDATDIGLVVAYILASPDYYAGRIINLAVEKLSILEIAGKLEEVYGTSLHVEQCSDAEAAAMSMNPVIATQIWTDEDLYMDDTLMAAHEFPLTSVEDFLAKERPW